MGSQTALLHIFSAAYDSLSQELKSDVRNQPHAMFRTIATLEWAFCQDGKSRPVVDTDISVNHARLVIGIIESQFSHAGVDIPENMRVRIKDLRTQSMGAATSSSVA